MDHLLKLLEDNLIIILPSFLVIFVTIFVIVMKRSAKKSKEQEKIRREDAIKRIAARKGTKRRR